MRDGKPGFIYWQGCLEVVFINDSGFPVSYQRTAEAYFPLVEQLEHKAGHFI